MVQAIEKHKEAIMKRFEWLINCGAEWQDVLNALKDISEELDVFIEGLEADIERAEEQAKAMNGKGEVE